MFQFCTEAVGVFGIQHNVTAIMTVNAYLILGIADIEGILLFDEGDFFIGDKTCLLYTSRCV